MRVLDEVADAIQRERSGRGCSYVVSTLLKDQFQGQVLAGHWRRVEKHLKCSFLDFVQGHYFLPEELVTIWDLCELVAKRHQAWEPPAERTASSWKNAQIFAMVRRVLAVACSVRSERIERSSRFIEDLGI